MPSAFALSFQQDIFFNYVNCYLFPKKKGKNIWCGWLGYWGENPFGVVDRIFAILNCKIEKDEKIQEYNFSRNINS